MIEVVGDSDSFPSVSFGSTDDDEVVIEPKKSDNNKTTPTPETTVSPEIPEHQTSYSDSWSDAKIWTDESDEEGTKKEEYIE